MSPLQIFARKKRDGIPLSMVALYDAPSAQIACDAGIDAILVGDSLGQTVHGFDSTIPVTMDMMAHHLSAVVRGIQNSARPDVPIIGDLPFGSYSSTERGVENAVRLMQLGAHAVKLEGVQRRQSYGFRDANLFLALENAGVPVMGHLGFTPQSSLQFDSIVQAKTASDAARLIADAQFLEEQGCFALVLEATIEEVAREITSRLQLSTIGIGAGAGCDGQVLVWHDLVGITARNFKFARAFAQTREIWTNALRNYHAEVEAKTFPAPENGWRMAPEEREAWQQLQKQADDFEQSDPFAEE